MNDQQKSSEHKAGQPQQNIGDPMRPDQAPAQKAPAQDQPGKTGESKESDGPNKTAEADRK